MTDYINQETENTPERTTREPYQPTLVPLHSSLSTFTNEHLGTASQIDGGWNVVVVDLSWLIYRSRFAFPGLSALWPTGERPTGHIYGALDTINALSQAGYLVILAVDSVSDRKEIYPGYKEGRKLEGYNPKEDQDTIIGLATNLPNVYYCRERGLEADDIISSFIEATQTIPTLKLTVMHNDYDILQIPGNYVWVRDIVDGFVQVTPRESVLEKRYSLVGLTHLPIWVKVIRGDASDNIKPGYLRYPTKKLVPLATKLAYTTEFEAFLEELKNTAKDKKEVDKIAEYEPLLRLNYKIVVPRTLELSSLGIKRTTMSDVARVAQEFRLGEYLMHYWATGGKS